MNRQRAKVQKLPALGSETTIFDRCQLMIISRGLPIKKYLPYIAIHARISFTRSKHPKFPPGAFAANPLFAPI